MHGRYHTKAAIGPAICQDQFVSQRMLSDGLLLKCHATGEPLVHTADLFYLTWAKVRNRRDKLQTLNIHICLPTMTAYLFLL